MSTPAVVEFPSELAARVIGQPLTTGHIVNNSALRGRGGYPSNHQFVNMKCVLDARQLAILRMRFVEGMSQQDIADEIGVNRQRIAAIIKEILYRLKRTDNLILDFD